MIFYCWLLVKKWGGGWRSSATADLLLEEKGDWKMGEEEARLKV